MAPAAADAGIDDETWLPTPGTARDAFLAAVELSRSDPGAAALAFVQAAGQAKYFYAAWYNAGAAAEASGDLAKAEAHYRQALKVRADHGSSLANLASVLERTGRAAEAQRLVADGLLQMPEKSGPHLAAATLAWSHKELGAAERHSLLALGYDDQCVPAMRLLAMVFRSQGRLDTARFALENALQVEPGNALLHLELGHVYHELEDDKAALLSFEKAARLRPGLLEAQDNYGVLLLQQGMAAEAVRTLEGAARLDAASARAQLHLGNAQRASAQYAQAETAYKKALALEPTLEEARFNLALLYIDNPLAGTEELARLQQGLAELKAFKANARPDAATLARLGEYLEATDKRIQKELKRREREERRKRDETADQSEPPPADAVVPAVPGQ